MSGSRFSLGKRILIILGVAIVVMQFFQIDRSNPPATAPLAGPAPVKAVLERACYDCHSNETRWPWYAYVAPMSWLVGDHVTHGRSELNFSEWRNLSAEDRAEMREEIYEEAAEGEMPPSDYLLLHSDAALSAEDLSTLRDWSAASYGDEAKVSPAPQLRQAAEQNESKNANRENGASGSEHEEEAGESGH